MPVGSVAVIIPARNEAEVVGHAVRSLLEQNYAGRLHIFLVDDDSSDNTATVARRVAEHARGNNRLTVVRARPLPDGWTGKLWALSEGLQEAAAFEADYFLLADADIIHRARQSGQPCGSRGERRLRPGLVDGEAAMPIARRAGADSGLCLLLFHAVSASLGCAAGPTHGCSGRRLSVNPVGGSHAHRRNR